MLPFALIVQNLSFLSCNFIIITLNILISLFHLSGWIKWQRVIEISPVLSYTNNCYVTSLDQVICIKGTQGST